MAQVEASTSAAPDVLALGEDLVLHDLEKMTTNAGGLRAELKERIPKAGVTRAPVENILAAVAALSPTATPWSPPRSGCSAGTGPPRRGGRAVGR
ncbi:hypothetical protein QM716_17570 [Rhodococcus sp. IEGM 1409]|uniref:hypothetical protein n=1 Tax=Rhodococcus sp. IEGM 1409 TaxID=3047082 RepID=UPI0024B6D74A|nr:hypothetical protein [Rhodococcus sp. IEGM 1409]MDI9901667.1 hypothetical protein [Rhodococcus sp. IEGM 1409]